MIVALAVVRMTELAAPVTANPQLPLRKIGEMQEDYHIDIN